MTLLFVKWPPIGGLFRKRLWRWGSALGNFTRVGVDGGGLVLHRRGLGGGGTAAAVGFLETIAVAVHGEDADLVDQSVEQGTGHE